MNPRWHGVAALATALVIATALGVATTLVIATTVASAQTWRAERNGLDNRSASTGTTLITKPAVRWRLYLGGDVGSARAVDVDFDGDDDVVGVEAGSVAARTIGGKLLWKTPPLGAQACGGRGDVDDDGFDELLCSTGSDLLLLNLHTGAIKWSPPKGDARFVSFTAVADFDGDGVADVAYANAGYHGQDLSGGARIYRFVGKPEQVAATPDTDPLGNKVRGDAHKALDVDGDGSPDILTALQNDKDGGHFFAWSGKTGKLIAQSTKVPRARCDSAVRVKTGDAAALIVCLADSAIAGTLNPLRGAVALQRVGAQLQVKWQLALPDASNDRFVVPISGVGDIDGDGKAELLASIRDKGAWRLEAIDALTGVVLTTTAKSAPLVTRAWLGSGGQPWLHAVAITGATPDAEAKRAIWTWSRTAGFSKLADAGVDDLQATVLAPSASTGSKPRPPTLGALVQGGQGGQLLRAVDADGDGFDDTIELVAFDGKAVATLAARKFAETPTIRGTLRVNQQPLVLVTLADGHAHALDPALKTINAAAGGTSTLRYGGQLSPYVVVDQGSAAGSKPLVAVSAAGRVLTVDASQAGPNSAPEVLLRRRFTPPARGNFGDFDGDGALELAVRHRSSDAKPKLTVLKEGAALWTYDHPHAEVRWGMWSDGECWAVTDVDGDGADDVVAVFQGLVAQPPLGSLVRVLLGKSGKSLWSPQSEAASALAGRPFAVDTTGSAPIAISSSYITRWRVDLQSGKLSGKVDRPDVRYGVPMLADLDGKPPLDAVWAGPAVALGAETGADHKLLWKQPTLHVNAQDGALAHSEGQWRMATLQTKGPALRLLDAKTGATVWQRSYRDGAALPPGSDAPADVQLAGLRAVPGLLGEGVAGLLFRSSEGTLYAVSAKDGAVSWTVAYGGALSDPVIADTNGDGLNEVLIAAPDGHLDAIGQDQLGAVDWVRENAGAGPALTEKDDIDSQEQADVLHVNWAALAGADGYAIRVIDDAGAGVVPLTAVGAKTSHSVTGLHLQPGRTYLTVVLAYTEKGAVTSYSSPRVSDGVAILDKSGPNIIDYKATPAVIDRDDPQTLLSAQLVDKTRLDSLQLRIVNNQGQQVYQWRRPLATASYAMNHAWSAIDESGAPLPTGIYTAKLLVTDTAKQAVGAELEIRMCGQGFVAKAGECVQGPVRNVETGADAGGVGATNPGVDQPSCQCDARGKSPLTAGMLLLLWTCGALLVGTRRRGVRCGHGDDRTDPNDSRGPAAASPPA